MPIEPLAISVCSWSLQVTSVPELKEFILHFEDAEFGRWVGFGLVRNLRSGGAR